MIAMLIFLHAIEVSTGGVFSHLSIHVHFSDKSDSVASGFNQFSQKKIYAPFH